MNAAQEKLETFYEEKTKGIIIRARARWHEHGEKSTKYFLNLEKRNHIKKHIRKLQISGVIKTDPFCILKEQERFYKNLYKSCTTDPDIALKISSFLNDLHIPTLSEDQKKFCEGKISVEECFRLLDSFDDNKTPGNDVLFGVLSKQCPLSNLLNYFIIIGKLFLWDYRRSQTLPKIQGLKSKLKIKYETEKNQQEKLI